ncbi:sulfurtransferase [Halorubrum sp. AJ67]|nr:sulfurtransferase [Halorubrum sp. AJ67]
MTAFLESNGIAEETTVVICGDSKSWFAAYPYWQLVYYGHPDVQIMDGGRKYCWNTATRPRPSLSTHQTLCTATRPMGQLGRRFGQANGRASGAWNGDEAGRRVATRRIPR